MSNNNLRAWYRRQQVVVTGGSGVIGRELVKRLRTLGPAGIVCYSRSGSQAAAPVVSHTGDLLDASRLGAALENASVVFHLAACKRASGTGTDVHTVNVDGTALLLALCRRRRPAVVFASTACVYAPSPRCREEDSAVGPVGAYAQSKLAAEAVVREYAAVAPAPALIARVANVYGTAIEPDTVIGAALAQAGGPVLRLRDLHPVRDFIHASDVAEALVRLAPCAAPACPVVNVGTGRGTSIAEVAGVIADWAAANGSRPIVTAPAAASATPDSLVLDNHRLRALTGWTPAVDLRAGLTRLLDDRVASGVMTAP